MDLRQIRYFLQVVKAGGFSSASRAAHVAQPALSRQIRALERELGVALLERTPRGVTPTEAGSIFAERGEGVLRDIEALAAAIRALAPAVGGEVVLGLPPTVGRVLTMPLTFAARDALSTVSLRIVEGFSGSLLEWLEAGTVDAAILYHRPPPPIISTCVASEALFVVAPAAALPQDLCVSLADLAAAPLILPSPGHGLRRLIDATAMRQGLTLIIEAEIDSFPAILDAVSQGLGWSILPMAAIGPQLASGQLSAVPIAGETFRRDLLIAIAPHRQNHPAVQRLKDLVTREIAKAAPDAHWTR